MTHMENRTGTSGAMVHLTGHWRLAAIGLTGLIAIFVALQAVMYMPVTAPVIPYQDHLFRLIAFASLTIWIAFTIGRHRSGVAAMVALVFASFLDLFIVPARSAELVGTLASANLGIVLAYCGLQLSAKGLKHW